jgi:hypothetical protein
VFEAYLPTSERSFERVSLRRGCVLPSKLGARLRGKPFKYERTDDVVKRSTRVYRGLVHEAGRHLD